MLFEVRTNQPVQIAQDPLMPRIRRWRHVVLPVDQLVPLPVVGEEQEVVVGELHAGTGRPHLVAPGHALILASRSERRAATVWAVSHPSLRAVFRAGRRVGRGRICQRGSAAEKKITDRSEWFLLRARGSVHTRLNPPSAPAGWGKSIGGSTRGPIASSRSRSSPTRWR